MSTAVIGNRTSAATLPPEPTVPFGKRALDIALAGVGLVVSSPIWLALATLISSRTAATSSTRRNASVKADACSWCSSFRSIIENAEAVVGALQATERDPRVTRIGQIMRSTAMDELPQLWNIFKGDMSFVGSRALRPGEIEATGGEFIALEDIPGYADAPGSAPA